MERINKAIAHAGLASRRGAEELIRMGQVRVNGKLVKELGVQVDPAVDKITVRGIALPKITTVTYILHKPKGAVTSTTRQGKEVIVTDFTPKAPPVYPVGRLDRESEGLILLSNDGTLTQRLTHPSFKHEKEYSVICAFEEGREVAGEMLCSRLVAGVKLGDGNAKADSVKFRQPSQDRIQLLITVHEGRHHLVRRMCATQGLKVISLRRTRIAGLTLGILKPGQYKTLSEKDLAKLA